LQRYSLLLGRINALSTYLAQPPPPPPGSRPPIPNPSSIQPALRKYIAHPLNALQTDVSTTNPLAPGVFFEALNTLPRTSLSDSQDELLSSEPWVPLDRLKRMNESELGRMKDELRGRLEREMNRVSAVQELVMRREEEVDWGMRIGEGEEEGTDPGEGEREDDLFGEGDEGDEDMKEEEVKKPEKREGEVQGMKNPREGWNVADYVRLMETGREPDPPRQGGEPTWHLDRMR